MRMMAKMPQDEPFEGECVLVSLMKPSPRGKGDLVAETELKPPVGKSNQELRQFRRCFQLTTRGGGFLILSKGVSRRDNGTTSY